MDYNTMFAELKRDQTINRIDFGMEEFKKLVIMKHNGYISKKEYNEKRKEIEEQIFQL